MPDHESELQRYALALSLVTDPTVAGDLFMDSWNDADLRRRAKRWSRRNGYQIATSPPVPVLTERDREYGLHLARRGRIKRWTKVALAVVLSVTATLTGRWLSVANRISGPFGTGRVLSAEVRMTHGAIPTRTPVPRRLTYPQDLLVIGRLVLLLDRARVEGPDQPNTACIFSNVLTLDLSGGRQIQVTPSCDRIETQEGNFTITTIQAREGFVVVHEGTQTLRMRAPDLYRWLQGQVKVVDHGK